MNESLCHQLDDYLDDGLDPRDRRAFEQHAADCGACAASIAFQNEMDKRFPGVRHWPGLTDPAGEGNRDIHAPTKASAEGNPGRHGAGGVSAAGPTTSLASYAQSYATGCKKTAGRDDACRRGESNEQAISRSLAAA